MKTTTVLTGLMALASTATAFPLEDRTDKGLLGFLNLDQILGKNHKDKGPFTFTSTYEVKATGKQVIGTDGVPAPGPDSSSGIFRYGINSDLNTICYVSCQGGDEEASTRTDIRTEHHTFQCRRGLLQCGQNGNTYPSRRQGEARPCCKSALFAVS